ncbi:MULTISPECIES: hypothetical protein [Streptomyces]|uniref:ParB N-terminal domain-containing protein n=1 Tax=Streptomyces luteosporeus TaxID=173856 RepID=A0ABN3TP63_9ACTN
MIKNLEMGRSLRPEGPTGSEQRPLTHSAHLVERVPVDALKLADSPRTAGEDAEHVRTLAEMDVDLPPLVVHRSTLNVIDGAHRLRAAVLRGDDFVDVCFFEGSTADAFVLAVELNGTHGLPLSLADRKAAAERIIASHGQWSDRRIAKVVGLAANTVGAIRRCSTAHDEQLNTTVGQDGRIRPRNSAEGRRRAEAYLKEHPGASLREIAKAAGISPGTAGDVRRRIHRTGAHDGPPPDALPTAQAAPGKAAPLRRTGHRAPKRISADVLTSLTKDPSLRFTAAGKILLRSLRICAVDAEQWARIVDAVPTHRQETIASLARECAVMWQNLADRLAERVGATAP